MVLFSDMHLRIMFSYEVCIHMQTVTDTRLEEQFIKRVDTGPEEKFFRVSATKKYSNAKSDQL